MGFISKRYRTGHSDAELFILKTTYLSWDCNTVTKIIF